MADRWHVMAASSRADDRRRVLKHDELFALFDGFGDVHNMGTGELGLFYQGTRFLSLFDLSLNGGRPMLLNSNVKLDNSLLTVDLTTPDLYENGRLMVLKGTVHVFRGILLWKDACHQHLRLTNYNTHPVALAVTLQFGADYADIFDVRGFKRSRRGDDMPHRICADGVVLGYRGLDGVTRRTSIQCTPLPAQISATAMRYEVVLAPRAQMELDIAIVCELDEQTPSRSGYDKALAAAKTALHKSQARSAKVRTSNQRLNEWINRSSADLSMLTTDAPTGLYPYAGVPWYSTPFGRDGILTAMQCLWIDPAMTQGVLAFLADTQASELKPEQDAEPGKILHEARKGELAAIGEIPFRRYYGSVDSTPLFIILAGAYYQRTGDRSFIQRLWPHVERALVWIDRYGDADVDGFVEYQRMGTSGLANQGWKDSEDAVFHRDGRSAPGAIALAEVQGYVYRAKLSAARLATALGHTQLAESLVQQAHGLRDLFEKAFWSEEIGTYALALDGEKHRCEVRASNAGQVLWSGIASPGRAQLAGRVLFEPESFSGWGIRTIAEGESRYNPMSYHNGSVWPHDNALIGMGLARYGMKDKAMALFRGMFEASPHMDLHRLPELFCGFVRRPNEGPTLYPVACSPQAWASATVFYFLQACLGVKFQTEPPGVTFNHPDLPEYLPSVEIHDLRVGAGTLDLAFERYDGGVGVNVLRKQGDAEVRVVV